MKDVDLQNPFYYYQGLCFYEFNISAMKVISCYSLQKHLLRPR